MISKATFERGAQELTTIAGEVPLNPRAGLCVHMSTSSSPSVKLVDARTLFVDLMGVLWNRSGGLTVTVKDNAGGTIGTIPDGGVSHLYLVDASTQAGVWHLKAKAFL